MQRTAAAVMVATLCAACSGNAPNPLQPSSSQSNATQASSALAASAAALGNSHGLALVAVAGEGQGIVNVSPDASQEGFSVETEVAVWRTRPETTFDIKRAVDVGTVCSSQNFVQLPRPNPGPLAKLTTSPAGAGSAHIKFDRPQIADGTTLAVRFQVSSEDSSIVLRTECFTVDVK